MAQLHPVNRAFARVAEGIVFRIRERQAIRNVVDQNIRRETVHPVAVLRGGSIEVLLPVGLQSDIVQLKKSGDVGHLRGYPPRLVEVAANAKSFLCIRQTVGVESIDRRNRAKRHRQS